MNNGDKESPGKKGEEDHQKEITDMNNRHESHESTLCNSATKPVFVVLFLKSPYFLISLSQKRGSVQSDVHAQTELCKN